MKAVSYCLFGDVPMYLRGMIRNLEQIKEMLPEWKPFVHIHEMDAAMVQEMQNLGATVIVSKMPNLMIARFCTIDIPDVDRMLVRDADSRFTPRDIQAIDGWLKSGKPWFVVRDHPHHVPPMGGGLWGVTKEGMNGNSMECIAGTFEGTKNGGSRDAVYNTDQVFLAYRVWHLANCMGVYELDFCNRHIHPNARPFPAKVGEWRFIGERYSSTDVPEVGKWESRINWMDA